MRTSLPSSSTLSTGVTLIVGRGSEAWRYLFGGEVRCLENPGQAPPLDGVAQIFLADPGYTHHDAMNWLTHADRHGITVWMPAELLPILKTAGIPPRVLGGTPVLCFAGLPSKTHRWTIEAISPFLALIILPFILPLLALLALQVWLAEGRPIVFAQRRIGFRGHRFTIYKFRTMQPARMASGQITASGELLRRHGLDELPQFFNLLKGNMALIGPRPLPVDEHPRENGIGAWMSTRERVRPGMTGLYQVCPHRRTVGLADMCILDAFWMHNRSPRLNAWILMRTGVAMLQGWGRRRAGTDDA